MAQQQRPRKKSKVKEEQQAAIAEFQAWLAENPDADSDRKVKMFDAIQDAHANR